MSSLHASGQMAQIDIEESSQIMTDCSYTLASGIVPWKKSPCIGNVRYHQKTDAIVLTLLSAGKQATFHLFNTVIAEDGLVVYAIFIYSSAGPHCGQRRSAE